MGIFDRVSKVISSNMNSLLDKAEDPRKSIDQLIEEMREQIRKGRQEVVAAIAAEKQLRQKVQEQDAMVDKWQHRAELAMKAGDEKLAREALLFKRKLIAERDRAEALWSEQRRQAVQLKDDLERAKGKMQQLESRKGTIAARYQQGRAGGGAEALGASGEGPTPFDEMRRIEESMERKDLEAEGMREARAELDATPGARMTSDELEAKFEQLEAKEGAKPGAPSPEPDVDAEMTALRKKYRIVP